jgi:hypothetical protein
LLRHRGVKGAEESRILIAAHQFVRQVRRFRFLEPELPMLTPPLRDLLVRYYGRSRVLLGCKLLVDKEPLEPIAFPNGDYEDFMDSVRTLLPQVRFVFMLREPGAAIWSMRQRKWGYSVTGLEPAEFSLEEHLKNWMKCAELLVAQRERVDVHLCCYDRLVAEPQSESKALCEFLGLRSQQPFTPQPARVIAFTPDELAMIRGATGELWRELSRGS